jgi:hypothetical protein
MDRILGRAKRQKEAGSFKLLTAIRLGPQEDHLPFSMALRFND